MASRRRTITVEGDAQITKALADVEGKLAGKAVRKGTRAVAKLVAERAKVHAPEDEGTLIASIKVRALARKLRRRGAIGHAIAAGSVTDAVGLPYYAKFQEFGWDDAPDGQPFLRPAMLDVEQQGKRLFKKILRSELKLA